MKIEKKLINSIEDIPGYVVAGVKTIKGPGFKVGRYEKYTLMEDHLGEGWVLYNDIIDRK